MENERDYLKWDVWKRNKIVLNEKKKWLLARYNYQKKDHNLLPFEKGKYPFLSLIIQFHFFLFIISKYCTEIDLNNFPPDEKLIFKTSLSFFAKKKMEVVRVLVVVGLVLGMLVEPSASLSECMLRCLLTCGNTIMCEIQCKKLCGESSANIKLHIYLWRL